MSRLGGGSPRGWALHRETGKGKGNSGVFREGSSLFPAAGCCPGDRAGHLVESLGQVGVSSQEKAAVPAPPPNVSGSGWKCCGQLCSPWCPGPRRDTGWGPEGTWKSYEGSLQEHHDCPWKYHEKIDSGRLRIDFFKVAKPFRACNETL